MYKKSKIFLSHTFRDRNPIKDRLISDLQKLDYVELWKNEEYINPSDSLMEIISQGIKESDYFLYLPSDMKSLSKTELEMVFVDEIVQQKSKVIFINIDNYKTINEILEGYNETIKDRILQSALVLNFTADTYKVAFSYLAEFILVNESDSIIQFQLNRFINEKPIILIADEVNEKLINYFSKHPNELKTIDRRLFEEFVAELFWGFGYQVELTQKTRDGGRDIIAIKNAETIDKYLIECKRPDIGNLIGIKPVRELFGVKQDEKATKAILATTSYFSKDAHQFFERNKWELEPKDFDGIMKWIKQYKIIKNIT